jgi:acyl dehydratase
MSPTRYAIDALSAQVGQVLGLSPWLTVDQARVNAFADATGDHQWIHIDVARAAAGPFGTTIAHGYLTLSLLPWMAQNAFAFDGVRMGVNYGLNKVRFPAPVPVGSRLQGEFRLEACEAIEGGWQLTMAVTLRRQDGDKPVCVAESVSRIYR